MNSHLTFKECPPTGKTKVFTVHSKDGITLAVVRWFSAWRRYTFQPSSATVWDASCLREVMEFLEKLMQERDPAHKKLYREAAQAMVDDMYGDAD